MRWVVNILLASGHDPSGRYGYLALRRNGADRGPGDRDRSRLLVELAKTDGDLSEGEQPRLSEAGLVYYLRHRPGWEPGRPFWPDSQGFMSVEAAKAAEAQVSGDVSRAW